MEGAIQGEKNELDLWVEIDQAQLKLGLIVTTALVVEASSPG